jgi:hypothetical protein
MFKLHFLKSVADVVASLTLDYQLIQNSLEFILICVQKIQAVFKETSRVFNMPKTPQWTSSRD